MADHVGTFCLVENGLTSAGAPEFLAACENAFVTRGKIVDGWAATASCWSRRVRSAAPPHLDMSFRERLVR